MKISIRIFIGFLSVLVLLGAVAIIGTVAINNICNGFRDYRSLALQTNESGRVQANMLTARLFVKNYVISASQENIDNVKERANATLELANGLLGKVDTKKNKAIVTHVKKSLEDYLVAFDEVTKKQDIRNELVKNKLEKIGPQIEQNLTAIMKSALEDNDAEAAYNAGQNLRVFLLTRLYASKFLLDNHEKAYKRVHAEMDIYHKQATTLLNSLQNPTRRKLAKKATELVKQYEEAFETVYKTINERNHFIKEELDRIGPDVAAQIENLKLEVKKRQDILGPQMAQSVKLNTKLMTTISIISALAGLVIAFLIGRSISKPIVSMTEVMKFLASGKLDTEVPSQNRKDEVGDMAAAVQVFKENALEVKRLEEEQKANEARAEEEKKRLMHEMANNFEATIGSVVTAVSSSSEELRNSAQSMSNIAEQTSERSSNVAAGSEEAAANVQTVAAAAEELSASINEISGQISESASIASTAVLEAQETQREIEGLVEATQKIGEVIDLINDIAEQTNLLALNATIEAARAGEAGKGFAVVASEVKDLAAQTAQATEEIGEQIISVQSATQNAVKAVQGIGNVIIKINEMSSSIASAVEQQDASTREIASNVQQASSGTQDVNENISGVQESVSETSAAADQILGAAGDLAKQSDSLMSEVGAFLKQVRAA